MLIRLLLTPSAELSTYTYKLGPTRKGTLGVQVPINGIELAIARWKELEKPSRTVIVAGEKFFFFILILVLESFLTWKVNDFYPARSRLDF